MGASHLISLNIAVLGFIGAVLFVLWNHDKRQKTALYWAVALTLVAIHWVVNLYRGEWSDTLVVLLNNPLVSLAVSLTVCATYIRVDRQPPWALLAIGWFATILPLCWYQLVTPHTGVRILIVSTSYVLHFVWAGFISLRYGPHRHNADILMSLCLVALAFLCAMRVGFLIHAGIPNALDHRDPFVASIILVAIPSVFVGCGLFVVLAIGLDLMEELRNVAERDPLTNTLNRRGFMARANQELQRAQRHNRPLAMIAGDLDFFKQVNDRFGHAAGDQAIVTFADILQAACREIDIVGRLGGEEFFVLLPDTEDGQAHDIAERVRTLYEGAKFDDALINHTLTASFGVAEMRTSDQEVGQLLSRADKALYQAKENGRNQVIVANKTQPEMVTNKSLSVA